MNDSVVTSTYDAEDYGAVPNATTLAYGTSGDGEYGGWAYATNWSAEHIVCVLPPLFGGGAGQGYVPLRVALALNGQQFAHAPPDVTLTVYEQPAPAYLAPPAGPATGGTRVEAVGLRMDAFWEQGTSMCHFGRVAVPIEMSDGKSATCTAPPHLHGAGAVEVTFTLNGIDFFGGVPEPLSFRYYVEPLLVDAAPRGGPTAGGTAVTLRGWGLRAAVISDVCARCKLCHISDEDATSSRCVAGLGDHGVAVGGGEYSPEVDHLAADDDKTGYAAQLPALPEYFGDAAQLQALGARRRRCATAPSRSSSRSTGSTARRRRWRSNSTSSRPCSRSPSAGPVDGGTSVLLEGGGFDAFGAVAHALAWSDDGGASATSRIVARCRFGDADDGPNATSPVDDMTPYVARCRAPHGRTGGAHARRSRSMARPPTLLARWPTRTTRWQRRRSRRPPAPPAAARCSSSAASALVRSALRTARGGCAARSMASK